MIEMETEERIQSASNASKPEIFLQWGKRKRLRCMRVKPTSFSLQPHLLEKRDSEAAALRSSENNVRKATPSPEKEDRFYTTRGSVGAEENGKGKEKKEERVLVWPKLYISLSSKEKEEDFMAMKGCRLPQRPKKRAKIIQRSLLLVSPGAWLTDMCRERYEVREKRSSKKRPRGLKAICSMESDSE
ncbi:hypothetical protein UlMin_006960 [Ulmus minor]